MKLTIGRLPMHKGQRIRQSEVIVFLTGVMALAHAITRIPLVINYGMLMVLFVLALVLYTKNRGLRFDRTTCRYLAWYGLFTVLVGISMVYTVNTVNPTYALFRVGTAFIMGLIVTLWVRNEHDFEILANGMITGGVLVSLATIVLEWSRVGSRRLGSISIGSGPTLSAILLVALACSLWHVMARRKNRKWYIAASVLFYAIIVLSGSRRAMLLAPVLLMLMILLNNRVRKGRKTMIFLIAALLILIALFVVLTNEQLYNLVGWRLETMVNSFLVSDPEERMEDDSMQLRAIMQRYAMDMFAEKPILGHGAHGFAYRFSSLYGYMIYSHNGFTEILSCYGVVGFIIFYYGFWMMLRKGLRQYKTGGLHMQMMICFALVSILTEMFTIVFLAPYSITLLSAMLSVDNDWSKPVKRRRFR